MREVRQRIALGFTAIVGYGLVTPGEADRLEGKKSDALGIVERELDNASDLLVVDAVDDGHDGDDLYSGGVQIFDGFQLHIEEVAYFAMRVGCVADAVELQIGVAHASFGGLLRELQTFREFNSVGCGLHAVVSNFARITHRVEEVRR